MGICTFGNIPPNLATFVTFGEVQAMINVTASAAPLHPGKRSGCHDQVGFANSDDGGFQIPCGEPTLAADLVTAASKWAKY